MRATGYRLKTTQYITDNLTNWGLVDHLEEQGEYQITDAGRAALDGLVLRATRLLDHRAGS